MDSFLPQWLNPGYLIPHFGLIGMFVILIVEAGLLIGVFLPGDSLLFAAGVFSAQGYFPLWLVYVVCFFGTSIGDQLGYILGKKYGVCGKTEGHYAALGRNMFKIEPISSSARSPRACSGS
jgi:membrane protein DedA with SNARE-associated domain